MFDLSLKTLLRKRGSGLAILAIGLLVAVVASMNSVTNYINAESQALSRLVNIGQICLILSANSTSITDSKLDPTLTVRLSAMPEVEKLFPQRVFNAELTTSSSTFPVYLRAVENLSEFLRYRGAYINGTAAEGDESANVGEIIAGIAKINKNDRINLKVDNFALQVEVAGTFTTKTNLDSEVILPLEAAHKLFRDEAAPSIIEFKFKDEFNADEVLNRLVQKLPEDVKIVKVHQFNTFILDVNSQTLKFINLWALAVYVVVATASYITAKRLIVESGYELAMLKALGAHRKQIFIQVLSYTAATALIGSTLGIALGVAGAQTASTLLRWMKPDVGITPFLQVEQAVQVLLLTLAFSIVGCIYPAYKSAKTAYAEQPL